MWMYIIMFSMNLDDFHIDFLASSRLSTISGNLQETSIFDGKELWFQHVSTCFNRTFSFPEDFLVSRAYSHKKHHFGWLIPPLLLVQSS